MLAARGTRQYREVRHANAVRNHVTNIFWKLGASSRAEAIVRAREAGVGVDTNPSDRHPR